MEEPEENIEPIGAFEPSDAKRVIARLEGHQIPFELRVDDSALLNPARSIQLIMGIYPEGSKIVVLVPTSEVSNATEALKGLFPV